MMDICHYQFSSVQSLTRVRLFVTPWMAAHQASLPITNSWSSPKLMCTESVMPFSHLILCHPRLLLPPIPPSINVFSNESTFHMRWPKYWSFSLSISPSKEHPGLIYICPISTERTTPRMNPKVIDGHWAIMMCLCRFMKYHKCITLVKDIDKEGGNACAYRKSP